MILFLKQSKTEPILLSVNRFPKNVKEGIVYVVVKSAAQTMGVMASNFYDNPSEKMQLVGITGTNGKTSIASLLYNLFSQEGHRCGLVSTVSVKYGEKDIQNTHTTPDAITVNQYLKEMVDLGVSHCFMEVSSHGIAQHRIEGLVFAAGVFTNLTHDHLDYHGSFKNYRDTKKLFFDTLPKLLFPSPIWMTRMARLCYKIPKLKNTPMPCGSMQTIKLRF